MLIHVFAFRNGKKIATITGKVYISSSAMSGIKVNEANRPAMIKNIAAPILGHNHPNPAPVRSINNLNNPNQLSASIPKTRGYVDINTTSNAATLFAIHLFIIIQLMS